MAEKLRDELAILRGVGHFEAKV